MTSLPWFPNSDWLFRRSQRDQGRTDYDEHSRSNQFSVCDEISKSLERHHGSVGKARPSREGDQAPIRGWVSGCHYQENAERDVKAPHHRQRRLLLHKQHQGKIIAVKSSPTNTSTTFSARSRRMMPPSPVAIRT